MNRLGKIMKGARMFWERWRAADVGVWRPRICHNQDPFHGHVLTIHQPKEMGNQMASARIPKHGFSSRGCDGNRLPKHYFRQATRPRCDLAVIDRVSILRTPSARERITKMSRSEMLIIKPFGRQMESQNSGLIPSHTLPITLLLCGVWLLCHTAHALDTPYQVETIFTYTGFKEDGQKFHQETWHWSVVVNQGKWLFRGTNVSGGDSREVYRLIGTDGTNIYRLSEYSPTANVGTNYIPGLGTVRIAPSESGVAIPYPDTTLISPLWFAYGSGYYLSSHKNAELKPIWYHDYDLFLQPQVVYPAYIELNENPPHLPKRTVFMSTGKMIGLKENRIMESPYPRPFDRGFTNAIFESPSFTNAGGVAVPTGFRLDVFNLSNSQNKPALVHAMSFVGTTVSVRQLSDKPETVPEVTTRVIVDDWRIAVFDPVQAQMSPVSYVMKSKWINSTNDPAVTGIVQAHQRKLQSINHGKARAGRGSVMALLILVTVTFGGVCAFLFMKKRSPTEMVS